MVRSPARGFIRDEPLLLPQDEPTVALDAGTEHALFERYATAQLVQRARRAASLAFAASLALSNL